MAVSPQTAIPMTLLLWLVRRRRGLVAGWAITLLLSLPVLVIAVVNAGGPAILVDEVRHAFRELVDVYRIDLPYLLGLRGVSAAVAGLVAVGFVALLLRRYVATSDLPWERRSGLLFAVAAPVTVLSVYHQPYDATLIFLAAVALLSASVRMPRSLGAASLQAGSVTLLFFVLTDAVFGTVLNKQAPAQVWIPVASPLVTIVGLLLAGASLAVLARSSLADTPR